MPSIVELAETSVENVCVASRVSNLGVLDSGEKPIRDTLAVVAR